MTTSDHRRSAPARTRRSNAVLVAIALLLLGLIALRLCAGDSMHIAWPDGRLADAMRRLFVDAIRDQNATLGATLLELRFYRVVVAMTAGAALALAGAALQALLRNVLAEPFILGLSSGAGLGFVVQQFIAVKLGLTLGAGHVGALMGALVMAAIVYALGRRRGALDPLTLLLTGVVLSVINGAAILWVNYVHSSGGLVTELSRWMMGYINETLSLRDVLIVMGVTFAGFIVLQASGRAMDVATFGDAEARSMGVRLSALRSMLFIVASALAAGAVVLAGPVAFVGLICPHLARLLLGPRHRLVLPAAAMLGAALVIAADTLTVLLDFNTGRFPIGIYTAIIGGPVFLVLFHKSMRVDVAS